MEDKVKSLKAFELSPFNTTVTKTEYFHWLWKYAMFFWILFVKNFIHVHVKCNITKKLSFLGLKFGIVKPKALIINYKLYNSASAVGLFI